MNFRAFDRRLIKEMSRLGAPTLRIALGIVFFWFGMLKLIGMSPATSLIRATYPLFPEQPFLLLLGVWELAIGLGLISNLLLRQTLALLWLQLIGTFLSFILNPTLFFQKGNPFLLTFEGEFIIKNLILLAASIVIGGQIGKKNTV